MTKQEAQEYLDSMLIPFSKYKDSIEANVKLSSNDKDLLLQIVIDFEAQSGCYDYNSALKKVAKIMQDFVKGANRQTKKGTKIVINPDTMPFLIKQVLFFITVSCIAYPEITVTTQNKIIDLIKASSVPISHNFFSRMDMTPNQYWKMVNHNQPELLINYVGQKRDDLAVAIKNLVYQAGKYDIFCDVFGGSGAASLAVDRRNDAEYAYNELNMFVYNLFSVVVDDEKYEDLIIELDLLQRDLEDNEPWLAEKEQVDFDDEINNFFGSNLNNEDAEILSRRKMKFDIDPSDINRIMDFVCLDLFDRVEKNEDFSFRYKGKEYSPQKLKEIIFPKENDTDMQESFKKNKELILAYYVRKARLGVIAAIYTKPGKTAKKGYYAEKYDELKQCRFYEYYAYFSNLLENPNGLVGNEVRYAVAEIFLQSFRTNGSTGISSIRRMYHDEKVGDISKGSKDAIKFLDRDFKEIITNLHKQLKGTICKRLDCIKFIKKYQKSSKQKKKKHKSERNSTYKSPLFYCDSPYIATVGYEDEKGGVGGFDAKKMKELILALKESEDKFIFSCRAVNKAQGKKKGSFKERNVPIFRDVFDIFLSEFAESDKELWVLVVEKGGCLAKLIDNNAIAEVMITNFEIHDFKDSNYPNVTFKVYSFWEFISELVDATKRHPKE